MFGGRWVTTQTGIITTANSKVNAVSLPQVSPPSELLQINVGGSTVQYGVITLFVNGTSSWATYVAPWPIASGWGTWVNTDPTHRQLVMSIDMAPSSVTSAAPPGSATPWYQSVLNGTYDTYYTQLAQALLTANLGNSVIRLALECNGTWNQDCIPTGSYSSDQSIWAAAWARIAGLFKAAIVAGKTNSLLCCWNINGVYQQVTFANYYPGNAEVDIIGIDQYNEANNTTYPVWATLAAQSLGVNDLTAFAVANNKPLALPEWGLAAPCPDESTTGYVKGIAGWLAAENFAWNSYFNNDDDGIAPLGSPTFPGTTAAYRQLFT